MYVAELARRAGRSVDTIKRWEDQNLLSPTRDSRGRRVYDQNDLDKCLQLARLSLLAQRRSEKLMSLAQREPEQLLLIGSLSSERRAG
jgi:DNA-binding transcriptional MerR regulator